MELKIQIQENFYSRASSTPEEEKFSSVDEEAARVVLAELEARKHPKRPPVRVFDALKVRAVARCSSAVDGDAEAKLAALRWALAAAWTVSDGPPSVRFVFGELEHFFEHLERGRARELALERHDKTPTSKRGIVGDGLEPHEKLAEASAVCEELTRLGLLPSRNPPTGHDAKLAENPSMRPPVPLVDKGDT